MDPEKWLRNAVRQRVAKHKLDAEHLTRAEDYAVQIWKQGNVRGEDVLRETEKAVKKWL